MANDIKWIKLSTGILDDEKIIAIEDLPDGPTLCWMWIKLLALAGRQNSEGRISLTDEIPYTEAQLANRFRMPLTTVQLGLNTFERFGMIEIVDDIIYTTNWARYQNVESLERVREKSRESTRRWREKKKAPETALPEAQRALPAPEESGKEDKLSAMDRRFQRFWKAYPKKTGKGAAEKSFRKWKPDDELTGIMIQAVERCKQSEQWRRDGGQYIPYPATWLNQKRWEDEPEDTALPFTDPPEPAYIRDETIEDWN